MVKLYRSGLLAGSKIILFFCCTFLVFTKANAQNSITHWDDYKFMVSGYADYNAGRNDGDNNKNGVQQSLGSGFEASYITKSDIRLGIGLNYIEREVDGLVGYTVSTKLPQHFDIMSKDYYRYLQIPLSFCLTTDNDKFRKGIYFAFTINSMTNFYRIWNGTVLDSLRGKYPDDAFKGKEISKAGLANMGYGIILGFPLEWTLKQHISLCFLPNFQFFTYSPYKSSTGQTSSIFFGGGAQVRLSYSFMKRRI